VLRESSYGRLSTGAARVRRRGGCLGRSACGWGLVVVTRDRAPVPSRWECIQSLTDGPAPGWSPVSNDGPALASVSSSAELLPGGNFRCGWTYYPARGTLRPRMRGAGAIPGQPIFPRRRRGVAGTPPQPAAYYRGDPPHQWKLPAGENFRKLLSGQFSLYHRQPRVRPGKTPVRGGVA
jgi:hypothetical protein